MIASAVDGQLVVTGERTGSNGAERRYRSARCRAGLCAPSPCPRTWTATASRPTTQKACSRSPTTSSTTRGEERDRELAVKQIQRKRRFQARAVSYGASCIVLTVVWAISEYNNAGGWPSSGFSQSSSIPHTWNIWIIYPILGLGLILAVDAWNTFGRRPISESEIQREVDRMHGAH